MHIEPGERDADGSVIGTPWASPDADIMGDIRRVCAEENVYGIEYAQARAVYPNPFYPWCIPVRPRKDSVCERGCWYYREGYAQCHDHSDGVCILAQGAGA